LIHSGCLLNIYLITFYKFNIVQCLSFKDIFVGNFSCHNLLAVSAIFTLRVETCEHGDTIHRSETFTQLRIKEILGVNDTFIVFIV
jgi:hypothetical protein